MASVQNSYHRYTVADLSYLRNVLRIKLGGFVDDFNLDWGRNLETGEIIVRLVVRHGDKVIATTSDHEEGFPSDELIAKLRLLLL